MTGDERRGTPLATTMRTVLSVVVLYLLFRGHGPLRLWVPDRLALDFLPQDAIIAIMAMLPGLLTTLVERDHLSAAGASRWPRRMAARLAAATALGPVLGGLAILAIALFRWTETTLVPAAIIKAVSGALTALIVTSLGLRAVLAAPGLGVLEYGR